MKGDYLKRIKTREHLLTYRIILRTVGFVVEEMIYVGKQVLDDNLTERFRCSLRKQALDK